MAYAKFKINKVNYAYMLFISFTEDLLQPTFSRSVKPVISVPFANFT